MASWKEERDRLVAQTLAFVQQVATTHPGAAQKLGLGRSTVTTAADDFFAQPLATAQDITPPDAEPIMVPPPEPMPAATPAHAIMADLAARPAQYASVSERAEIAQRVAAFKARQTLLNREREAYYDSVQARIRTSLRNDPGTDRL